MPSFSLVDCFILFCVIFERQTAYQRIVRKKKVFLPFLSSLLREEAGTFHNFSETKNRERCFRPGWAPPGSRLRSLFFACTHAGAHHRSPLSSFFAQTRAQQTWEERWREGPAVRSPFWHWWPNQRKPASLPPPPSPPSAEFAKCCCAVLLSALSISIFSNMSAKFSLNSQSLPVRK